MLFVALPRSAAPWVPIAVVGILSALSLAALALIPGPAWLLIALAIIAGAVRGAQTLIQGNAVADRWGTEHYGSINGAFAAPITITAALTPAIGPLLATGLGGYAAMALVMAGIALLSALLARWS